MGKDFEIVNTKKSRMNGREIERVKGEIVDIPHKNYEIKGNDKLMGAVADNFDRIVDIAASIVEINKIKDFWRQFD